ncbi:MAG: hypothetical protein ACO3NZ_13020 [Pirellulales bacterium]|jgi:hypothetical protein
MSHTAAAPWFDERAESPILAEHARKLTSFLEAVADGQVDLAELEAQERRVVDIMKQVEPLLSAEAHAKVTELLHEVTAYDMMNTLYMASKSRRSSG